MAKKRKNKNRPKAFDRSKQKNSISDAILDTLSYRAIFDYPMSYRQLYTYLITPEPVPIDEFRVELRNLCKGRKVKTKSDLFHAEGIEPVNWHTRAENSRNLLTEVSHVIAHLKSIPWVKMIAVTGAVAARNAPRDDDIDLFIITAKDRLWITRFFVVLYCKIFNVYRTDASPAGKICPNLFISEDSMSWPKSKRNLYVAHEILLMHPIYSKDAAYFRFLAANRWVLQYFKNFYFDHVITPTLTHKHSTLVNIFEKLMMHFQLRYMKKKITTEVVNAKLLHFAKTDHSQRILNNL